MDIFKSNTLAILSLVFCLFLTSCSDDEESRMAELNTIEMEFNGETVVFSQPDWDFSLGESNNDENPFGHINLEMMTQDELQFISITVDNTTEDRDGPLDYVPVGTHEIGLHENTEVDDFIQTDLFYSDGDEEWRAGAGSVTFERISEESIIGRFNVSLMTRNGESESAEGWINLNIRDMRNY